LRLPNHILFQFFQAWEGTFLIGHILEMCEFVLNRFNLDFYSNGADPTARTVASTHTSAAGSLPMPPGTIAEVCLSAAVTPLQSRYARTHAYRPRVVATGLPCGPPSHSSPSPLLHAADPFKMGITASCIALSLSSPILFLISHRRCHAPPHHGDFNPRNPFSTARWSLTSLVPSSSCRTSPSPSPASKLHHSLGTPSSHRLRPSLTVDTTLG
jgi:hypothetical protein